jgi:hypothetical protein
MTVAAQARLDSRYAGTKTPGAGPHRLNAGDHVSDGSVAMTEHAVVIAGCGPTGMMLAGERPFARGR